MQQRCKDHNLFLDQPIKYLLDELFKGKTKRTALIYSWRHHQWGGTLQPPGSRVANSGLSLQTAEWHRGGFP